MKNIFAHVLIAAFLWSSSICLASHPSVEIWRNGVKLGTTYQNIESAVNSSMPGDMLIVRETAYCETTADGNKTTAVIYPNPVKETLFIKKNSAYIIRNITGLIVKQGFASEINVSGFAAGLYTIEINGAILKFTKE